MQPGGPGWNDPPKLSYQVHHETKSRRNLLNKRVAYLDHHVTSPQASSAKEQLNASMPPPVGPTVRSEKLSSEQSISTLQPAASLNIFTPAGLATDSGIKPTCESVFVDGDWGNVTTSNFPTSLVEMSGAKSDAEMRRKLDVLKQMNDNNDLSPEVKEKMVLLTRRLCAKRYDEAWDIHIALTCDHISQVLPWMPGIKRLINLLRE